MLPALLATKPCIGPAKVGDRVTTVAASLAVADQVAHNRARLGHTASVLLRPKRLFGIHREASVAMFFNPDAERVRGGMVFDFRGGKGGSNA